MWRKIFFWAAGVFASLAVLLVLFYAEEDWRGARDWAACQQELAAKGEILDLRQLAPPGKPEDDLSKVPIFAELYQDYDEYLKTKSSTVNPRIRHIRIDLKRSHYVQSPKLSNYHKGTHLDLIAWQKYYRALPEAHLPQAVGTPAQDVLQALSQLDPELKEIDTAVSNPNAYWPINYERPFDGYWGGVTEMLSIANVIQLKGVAHLENHEADLAEKDYLFSFRLNQPLAKGCFLVNYLVMMADRSVDDSILWEGLHCHAWSDVQLREMESALASTDMLALGATSLRSERALSIQVTTFIQQGGINKLREAAGVGKYDKYGFYDAVSFLSHRPSGIWDQDKSFETRELQKRIEAIHPSQGTMDSVVFDYDADWSQRRGWKIWYVYLSMIALPNLDAFGEKIADAETSRRLARLACRLEEYRLAHGQYPDTLNALPDLPTHLNQEVLSEQPLRYQRKGDGYLLYSVGWNQKDDGGLVTTDEKEGDWVWPSP